MNYRDNAVPILKEIDDENTPLREKLVINFDITKKISDEILVSEVENIVNDDKKKIKNELESLGVNKKRCNKGENRNKWVYCGLKIRETNNDE